MEKKQIQLEDFLAFQYLSDPGFSPDGRYAAFVVTTIDREKNAYRGDLWLLEREGRKVRRLTAQGDAARYFWTERNTLCFPAKRGEAQEKRTVFYEISPEGGEAVEAFSVPLAVSSIRPVSGGLYAVTAAHQNAPEHPAGYDVMEEAPFWYNGMGITSGQRRRLYLFDRSSGSVTPVSDPWTAVGNYEVRGSKIAYQATPWQDYQEFPYAPAIRLYDWESGRDELVMERNTLNDFEMTFWKDDELLFSALKGVPGNGMGQNADFYTLNLTTREVSLFAKMDRVIGFGGTGSDAKYGGGKGSRLIGEAFYFISPIDDGSYLNRIDQSGAITRKILDAGDTADSVESFDVYGGDILTCRMARSGLAELYWNGEQVTFFNDAYLREHDVRAPRFHSFTASDGFEIHGWCMTPRGYQPGRKYPAILHIHGGPKTVFGDVYHHEMQVWANAGYFVLYCNPRGSDGRGKEFADINGKWGTVDYQNLMDFTDEMLRQYPDIDPARVGVCGGSYGGFMTNWIIGQTNRFAAACSQRSMANMINFEYLSDIGHTSIVSEHLTTVEEDVGRLWDESPLKYAPKCVTPTLFIQSDEDYRCYMADALSMFACLKRHGCAAKLCLFHGENHELSRSGKPENRISRMREILAWFDQYLKRGE